MSLIAFNKPCRVLSQFTSEGSDKATLADYIDQPGFYCAGRLDYDSEGLLLLTNDGRLQHQISHPRHKLAKVYFAQVEGNITDQAIQQLCDGVRLRDGPASAETARPIAAPDIWAREPPVRARKHIPVSWLEIVLSEGRNRQVRRMTAAVGFPTLRLVRWQIGPICIKPLAVGEWRHIATPRTWQLKH